MDFSRSCCCGSAASRRCGGPSQRPRILTPAFRTPTTALASSRSRRVISSAQVRSTGARSSSSRRTRATGTTSPAASAARVSSPRRRRRAIGRSPATPRSTASYLLRSELRVQIAHGESHARARESARRATAATTGPRCSSATRSAKELDDLERFDEAFAWFAARRCAPRVRLEYDVAAMSASSGASPQSTTRDLLVAGARTRRSSRRQIPRATSSSWVCHARAPRSSSGSSPGLRGALERRDRSFLAGAARGVHRGRRRVRARGARRSGRGCHELRAARRRRTARGAYRREAAAQLSLRRCHRPRPARGAHPARQPLAASTAASRCTARCSRPVTPSVTT